MSSSLPPAPRVVPRRGTGEGVRIAIVDSGVHATHPHVGGIAGGLSIAPDGRLSTGFVDRLGHGTAVAAVIHEKAPRAALHAVRIFETALTTTVTALAAAIEWAVGARMHILNLSLGTAVARHEDALREAVTVATRAGLLIVAARDDGDTRWLPGSLEGVVSVRADATCPRRTIHVVREAAGVVCYASPFPRPIPGVPPARNLNGISFAVANVSGVLASALDCPAGPLTLAHAIATLEAVTALSSVSFEPAACRHSQS
ncbi:MAG: S8 family serine peptidase [Vicinamibacterales bacterium]